MGGGGAVGTKPHKGAPNYLPANWGDKFDAWSGSLKKAIKNTRQIIQKKFPGARL